MGLWSGLIRSRRVVALSIGVGVAVAVMGLRQLGVLEPLELGMYDRHLRARAETGVKENRIVLVRIREADIRRFGHPVCDDLLKGALETLLAAEPRAIGVDLYRDAPAPQLCRGVDADDSVPAGYLNLGRTVTASDRVVMVMKLPAGSEGGTPAPTFLEGTDQVGFSDLPVDRGGTIRRGLLYGWEGEEMRLSFSLQLALRYLNDQGITATADPEHSEWVRLGAATIPPFQANDGGYAGADDGGYQFLLDYRPGLDAFPSFTLEQVLERAVPESAIRDKIVFVGTTAPSVKDDLHLTFYLLWG